MYDNFGSTNANELIFTGDTSNIVKGVLYDTDNRELHPGQGRWLSPDPAGTGWNQYAYGTDPNTQTDPSGLWITGVSFLYSEGMRGPFNAGMDMFPGLDQGGFSPVPGDQGAGSSSCGSRCSSSRDTQEGGIYYNDGTLQWAQNLDASAEAAKSSAQSAGAVSSTNVGGVWVNAYGETAAQQTAELAAVSKDLTDSDRGKAMLSALEARKSGWFGLWGSPKPFDIIQMASGGSYSYVGGQSIMLDYHDVGAIYTSSSGGGTYSLERIFAHELGHAAMGNLDNGPGRMNNVNWNENLVMRQLGDSNDRTAY